MYRITGLIFVIVLLSINILADIPPPPVGEKIRIELKQDYTDYDFYLASYDLKVVPNPNPPHVSRPNMVVNIPESFKLRKINLSFKKPFTEAITSARIQNRGTLVGIDLWLVAVKKSLGSDIESKVKAVIDGEKDGDGIYAASLEQMFESHKDGRRGVKLIVNTVMSLDEKGLKINASEGTASLLVENETPGFEGKTPTFVGLGLLLTGLAFVGVWWARKRFV